MTQPLLVDLYNQDLSGKPDIAKLIAAGPPWSGIIFKASEGQGWSQGHWFTEYWPQAKQLAGDRYGDTWWRGAYHYVHFMDDPTTQVDFYMNTVKAAGDWSTGDLWPTLDVERADNPDCSASQIVDCVSKMAELLLERTGVKPTLYGGSLLYDKGIKDHMGCGRLWIARYAATLPEQVITRIGWSEDELMLWQYDGDGEEYLEGYPKVSPIGASDISALVLAGGLSALKH